ncbi:hypothetical protein HFO56_39295 [Rhizobium laguerreae]|uniref:hypothetical protein n=1 Tax=Rhizobium laguerreae TaxID=1076926 RepID=UPI001C920516|nr:hypothetical protein [Rhizobium laguerreae]MBY3158347.1 hypothetical protein [Rhizobium laguerreae]
MPLTVTTSQTDQIVAALLRAFDGEKKPRVAIYPLQWDDEECEHFYPCKITIVTGTTAPTGLFSGLRTPKSNGFSIACIAPVKGGTVRRIDQFVVSAMVADKNLQELPVPMSEALMAKFVDAIQVEVERVATTAIDFDARPIVPKHGVAQESGTRITLSPAQAAKVVDEIARHADDPDAIEITVGKLERDRGEYHDFRHCTALVKTDPANSHGFLISWDMVVRNGAASYEASQDSPFSIRTVVDGKVGCKLHLPSSRQLEEMIFPVMQSNVDNADAPTIASILGPAL